MGNNGIPESRITLDWFSEQYPDKDLRYEAISEYLWEDLEKDEKTRLDKQTKAPMINWIDEYVKNRTGLSPLQGAISMEVNFLQNKN